jgi:hypothetical protein
MGVFILIASLLLAGLGYHWASKQRDIAVKAVIRAKQELDKALKEAASTAAVRDARENYSKRCEERRIALVIMAVRDRKIAFFIF